MPLTTPMPASALASVPDQLASPSLKYLIYDLRCSDTLDPHLELLLKSHAATLEKVELNGCTVPVGLLVGLPKLSYLSCPLLDDMPGLLQCPSLNFIRWVIIL